LSPYELLVSLCGGTWNGVVVHIVTNVMIGLAYISIPIVIVAYLRRRPDIENRWVFWCFTAFILGCGFTYFGHVLALLDPRFYVFSQVADIFTAVVSALTAIALWPLLPTMARIPTPRQLLRMIRERDEAVGQLGQHKEILVKELNHRVRNNLQILQSVVAMMMRDSGSSGTPPQQLLGTILNRIMAVSRVHDRIYADNLKPGQIETREFIESICEDLGTQFGAVIETDIDRMMMSVDESVPVAMILNELVTNAVKYGRRADQPARVKVVFKRLEQGRWVLSVEDNGPGISPDAEKSRSIGMRLIRSLATQLGGVLEVASSPSGSRFSISGAMGSAGAGQAL
jgi:two-component sensor histidine kinase